MFDFNGVSKLNSEEIEIFNKYFNKEENLIKLKQIEESRKENLKKILLISMGIVFILLISAYFLGFNTLIPIGIISLVLGMILYYFIKNNINLKNNFIGGLLKYILGNELKYSEDGSNLTESVRTIKNKTNLLNSFDRIDFVEDSLSYKYKINENNSISLEGAEIRTSKKSTDSKGKTQRSVSNQLYLFKLTFNNARYNINESISIKTDFHDNIYKKIIYIIVISLLATGFIVSIFHIINIFIITLVGIIVIAITYYILFIYGVKDKVDLDNVEFEKKFDVFSKDKILARQILNTAIMQNIVDFTNNTNKKYSLFLLNNEFYITYNVPRSYLEFSPFTSIYKNIEGFAAFYIEIKNIIKFVDEINLLYFDSEYFNKKDNKKVTN